MSTAVRSLALLGLATLIGCGGGGGADNPDIGTVTGVVKLDGNPLPNAKITFEPQNADTGRPSTGTTNDAGEYELTYSRSTMGAQIATHKVSITTYTSDDADDGGTKVTQAELVPDVYNVNTELEETVKGGANEINFDLDSSKGKIVQPRE